MKGTFLTFLLCLALALGGLGAAAHTLGTQGQGVEVSARPRQGDPAAAQGLVATQQASRTTVPRGTLRIRGAPFLPEHCLPAPLPPFSATYFRLYRKSMRVDIRSSTWRITSPPRPPSPPSGPPAATYFSR